MLTVYKPIAVTLTITYENVPGLLGLRVSNDLDICMELHQIYE